MSRTKPLSGDILARLVNATLLTRLRTDLLDGAKVGCENGNILKLTSFPSHTALKKLYPYEGTGEASYFRNLLKWIKSQSGGKEMVCIGVAEPNSQGIAAIHTYKSQSAETEGMELPMYSSGIYIGIGFASTFSTSKGEFQMRVF